MNNDMSDVFYSSAKNAECINNMPLAMVYMPMQNWKTPYEPDVALERGTMFSELDKPFLGKEAFSI